MLAREPGRAGDGHFARRADVERKAFLRDPSGHRAAQERLARVGDFRIGERRGVAAAAVPDVGLVEDESGRAVPRGQRAQPQSADGDLPVGLMARRMRPDVRGKGCRYMMPRRRIVTSSGIA